MPEMTFKELNKFIHDFTAAFSEIPTNNIRRAYARGGTAFNNINDNAVYYNISMQDNFSVNQINAELTGADDAKEFTREYWHPRTFRILWTFYGDIDIVDVAARFRGKLFSEPALQMLKGVQLGIITDFASLNTLPELINNQWYYRADLSVDFNYYHADKDIVPAMEVVDFGLAPNPTHTDTIIGVEDGEITEIENGSDLYRDIELDIEELRKIAEQIRKGK